MTDLSTLTSQIVTARDAKKNSFIKMRESLMEISSTIKFINSLVKNHLWNV